MPSKCALRFTSRTVPIAEIVSQLGLPPTKSYEIGQPFSRHTSRVRDASIVIFEANAPAEAPLERHIAAVLDLAMAHKPELAALKVQCEVDIFCMYASESGQGS